MATKQDKFELRLMLLSLLCGAVIGFIYGHLFATM